MQVNDSCPACPKKDGTITIALDANFGLVHKRQMVDVQATKLKEGVFFPQNEVDAFVNQYNSETKGESDCSNFQAGSAMRSQSQTSKLDVTGIFGSCCQHEVPLKFMNLRHGERLAYPVYLLSQLVEKYRKDNIKLHVMYDIACMLKAHLKKNNRDDLLQEMELAIPVFHCYGHQASCQILLSPRRVDGFGLVDGETMERLWSYLRRFCYITKVQTSAHREELLCLALHHYGQKKMRVLEYTLVARLKHAQTTLETATEQLHNLLPSLTASSESVTEVQLSQWQQDERKVLTNRALAKTVATSNWEEQYVAQLSQYDSLSGEVLACSDIERASASLKQLKILSDQLARTERRQNITRWRTDDQNFQQILGKVEDKQKIQILLRLRGLIAEKKFLFNLQKKESVGQKVAYRISRSITNTQRAIQKEMTVFNGKVFLSSAGRIKSRLDQSDVKDTSTTVFQELLKDVPGVDDQTADDIPHCLKQQAIDLKYLIERSNEEIVNVKGDMKCFYASILETHSTLKEEITRKSANNTDFAVPHGLITLMLSQLNQLESRLTLIFSVFSQSISGLTKPPSTDYIPEVGLFSDVVNFEVLEDSDLDGGNIDSDDDEPLWN